jgi:hypothetical protein
VGTGEWGLASGLLPTLSTSWPFHCEAQSQLAELAIVGEVRGAPKFVFNILAICCIKNNFY